MEYKLSYLLKEEAEQQVSLEKAMDLTSLDREELLAKLNHFEYEIDNKNILNIKPVTPGQWTSYYLNISEEVIYDLKILERQLIVFLMILLEENNTSIYHFQHLLKVSRGTILNDIKSLKEMLENFDIEIKYDRSLGYFLEGNINSMLKLARNFISKLLETDAGNFTLHYFISKKNLSMYAQTRDIISNSIRGTNYKLVPSRISEIVFFSIFSRKKLLTNNQTPLVEMSKIKSLSIYPIVLELFVDLFGEVNSDVNLAIYTVNILTVLQGNIREPAFDFLLQLSAEIIHNIEKYAAIQFKNFRELLFNVYNHLVPAFFRIKYDLYLSNVLMDEIQSEYQSIFHITKLALQPLENATKTVIKDEEVGYFTILFGGAINAEDEAELDSENFKALIVCPNGVSSSLILESELRILFPNIDFIASNSIEGIKNISRNSYDFIFSTVPIDTYKKVYIVKPIMKQIEKNKLINIVQSDWLIPGFTVPNIETIIDTIKPYMDLKDGVTEEQLYKVLNRKIYNQFKKEENYGLRDYLVAEHIQFIKSCGSWEQAIEKAAEPLLIEGLIDERYIEAMIQNIYQYGAYIHMGNQIALPHASPEDGVYRTSFSMLVLEDPIEILNNSKFKTKIIFVLAPADSKQHLTALNNLITIISADSNIKKLFQAVDKKQILSVIGKD